MVNSNKEEIKERVENLFGKIGSMGYFCPEVKKFYQELEKRLKKNTKEIESWLENQIKSFLNEVHPGKVYALTGVVSIFSLSGSIINIVADQLLNILKGELAKLNEDPYYKNSPGGLDLRLGCLNFLSKFFSQMSEKNQKHFLEICEEIQSLKNENPIIKKQILEVTKFIRKN